METNLAYEVSKAKRERKNLYRNHTKDLNIKDGIVRTKYDPAIETKTRNCNLCGITFESVNGLRNCGCSKNLSRPSIQGLFIME